jgi:hypothetical protein
MAPGVVPPGMMQPGMRASVPPGMMAPGMMPPGMMPPGMMPPGARPSFPPGARPSMQPGSMPPPGARPSIPPGASSAPPPRSSLAPMRHVPLKGNYMDGTGELKLPTGDLSTSERASKPSPDPFGKAGLKPDLPPRAMSEITNIDASLGDNSKVWLLAGIGLLVVAMVLVMSIGKKPPEGLADESVRKRLPKELIEEALRSTTPIEGDPLPADPEIPPQPDLVAPPKAIDPLAGQNPDAPPVVPEVKWGVLSIDSEPKVDVFDGDRLIGRTPVRQKLKAGSYKLRFTDKDKMINRYKQYTVQPDGDHKDTLTFGEAQLLVEAPSGSRIFLNGRPIGKAPIEPYDLYEGRYLLKVTYEGKTWSEWFNAPAGRKIEYRVRMD